MPVEFETDKSSILRGKLQPAKNRSGVESA